MTRLPQPGKDAGQWGDILNDFLAQSHKADGSLKDDVVGAAQLQDNAVTETILSSAVQTKLNQTAPVTKVNNQTGDITLTKTDIGLSNVDNTADTAKPISTTQQAALDLKADTTALAAKLNTADLDAQTAAKITTDGTATQVALSSTYAPGVSLPDANGTNDTTAIQAILTANPGKRIVGKPGASYKISAPLVISSGTTLDMSGCTITLLAGSNCRMLQNAALLGAGARDTDIHIRGGYWDRGANAGVGFNLFGICLHRADRASVKDARFHATAGKYACYAVDVTEFTAERLEFTTESDGLHITGPASNITVRDITGTTNDDLVSITGRDYTTYELTAGGGNITDVLVERISHRGGDANTVKLLPGAAMVMSNVTVRDISGNPDFQAVTLFSDTEQASTTGGTIRNVTVENVSGAPATGIWVQVICPDVQGLKIKDLKLDKANGLRGVSLAGTGPITDVTIEGVTTIAGYTGAVCHVGTGCTVNSLSISNAKARDAGLGIVYNSGSIGQCQLSDILHTGTQGVIQGTMPTVVQARNVISSSPYTGQIEAPTKGLYLTGASGNYVATPDSAALSLVGDLDLRCKVTLADWTPASDQALITKHAAGKAWNWFVDSAGKLSLLLSTDGANWLPVYFTTLGLGFTDGTPHWLRVTVDVNDGSGNHVVKFYTSTAGAQWTLLDTVTRAGVIALLDTADQVELGGRSSGNASQMIGAIHFAEIRNGLGGAVVGSWDGTWPHTRQRDAQGNVWTVNGTACSWAVIN